LKRFRGRLPAPESPVPWGITALVIILLVATFFRTHLFAQAPPGLQHDEIFKANFALEVLDGGWPVFFDPNGGEEALFPYLAALSISLFGRNFFALRFVSLWCGILSIAFSYSLIGVLFGRRVALLTAAGLAVSFWHIFDSRVALRPITLLLMAVVSFLLFWLALKRGRLVWFVLAGISMGASFYTYTSGFLVPLTIVLFILLYQLPFQRALLLRRWRGIMLAFALALVVFTPMAYHIYSQPTASMARARDLSDHINLFLAGDPGPVIRDVLNALGMFGLRGDPEWRYNVAGRPVFDLLTFALFCAGLVICLARIKRPEYAFLLVWLCVNLVPSAVTRHSPSSLRAIGSLTAVYALPSLTIDFAWDWAASKYGSLGRRALCSSVVLLFVFTGLFAYRDYFMVWAANPEVRDIYRADLSAVARYLGQTEDEDVVCVSATFAADLDQQVLNLMMGEQRSMRWFDGQQALVFPDASSSEAVVYIFPATGPLRDDLMNLHFGDLPVTEAVLDPQGEPAFVAYRVGPEEMANVRSLQPQRGLSVNLEDRVEMIGYEMPGTVEAGGELPVLLYWRVSQPTRPDLRYAFFAHLVDLRGYVWDQVDTLGYPVSSWIEGDLVVQAFDLSLPPDMPPLDYQVKMGMYDLSTGERLTPVVEGAVLLDGVVVSERFPVTKAATPPTIEELDIPRKREANFDDELNLLGCDLAPLQVGPGDPVHISLYWQALAKPQFDYLISVLLTDNEGKTLDELTRQPLDGYYPTTQWEKDEVVRDRFDLFIDAFVPSGRHRLWVRVYDPNTQTYLPLVDSEGDRVRVGKVRVVREDGG